MFFYFIIDLYGGLLYNLNNFRQLYKKEVIMTKYVCNVCGYVYEPIDGDPDNGIAPGTPFEDIPDDWTCPLCGVGKENFSPEE